MNHIDLFSGIGGFSFAAQRVWGDEYKIVCFVEQDEFCQQILNKRWPNVPIVEDVRDVRQIVAYAISNTKRSTYRRTVRECSRGWDESGECKGHEVGGNLTNSSQNGTKTTPPPTSALQQMSIFSQGDSPAKVLVSPGSSEARKMTAISGRKCLRLSKRSDPVGLLAKMLLESSIWRSTLCFLTWKLKATPHNRLLYQLAPKTPRTDGIGSGLWLTPSCEDHKSDGPKTMQKWVDAAKEGKRPDTSAQRLRNQVKMWPTPQTGAHNKAAHNAMSGDWKKAFCKRAGIPMTGQLNPTWVEWLMGYPPGWTDLNHSETP